LDDKAAERADWLARVQAETAAAEQAKRELQQRKQAQGRAVSEWNEQWLAQKREAKRRQQEADKEELERHLADYHAELQRKRMDQVAMQREMAAYREYLTLRKAEERRQEEELDRVTRDYQVCWNAISRYIRTYLRKLCWKYLFLCYLGGLMCFLFCF